MGCVTSLAAAAAGNKVGWIVPTYRNGRPLWRMAETAVGNLKARGLVNANRAERLIDFPQSGGTLGIYSADSPDSMRGEAFHLVILDEAARIAPEVWTDVIQPTLADHDGEAILFSTPKGRNWFYEEWMRARVDGAAWQAPSSDNPSPMIRHAAMLAQTRVSERTYRQEWLAQFVESGAFFPNVRACSTAEPQGTAIEGHTYAIGVDWARASGGDFTVLSVLDATWKCQAELVRFSGLAFDQQLVKLRDLWQRFGNPAIIAEYNSMGGPLVEQLQREGLPVWGFTTTSATKHEIITALENALDRKTLSLLSDPIQIGELEVYEKHERTGVGLPRYGAPEGMHDDTVMALALAWHAASVPMGVALVSF